MINAIIIDDEAHCVSQLCSFLHEYCEENLQVAGTFQSVKEGITGILKLQPDLVFLDVQMDDKTGFDLLKEIPEINFEIIFTTAYEKYAVQAFKFSAIDYLLKPVDADDLVSAVNKVIKKISGSDISQKINALFHNLQNHQSSKKISIPTLDGLIFLDTNDIIRCQSHINYSILFLKDKQKITVAKTLKEFEELLSDYNFYRVHNSHLINLAYIKKYNKGKGGSIFMSDHSEVEVSSRRKEGLLKRLLIS
ncbi:MAG TPA: LytTR family DNA-binding domain-containing protein [Hanamia sp.]|jgi:two-component system, LytTR family, response regulator|nr:LytTR family DNA-binding domain-containing protein [Hanamia sp.]